MPRLRQGVHLTPVGFIHERVHNAQHQEHMTFNRTFPHKQILFSREVKDLVILPLLQETCKDTTKGLLF